MHTKLKTSLILAPLALMLSHSAFAAKNSYQCFSPDADGNATGIPIYDIKVIDDNTLSYMTSYTRGTLTRTGTDKDIIIFSGTEDINSGGFPSKLTLRVNKTLIAGEKHSTIKSSKSFPESRPDACVRWF